MNLEDIAESIIKAQPLIPTIQSSDENGIFESLKDHGITDLEFQGVLEELLLNAIEHGLSKDISIYLARHVGWTFAAVKDGGPGIHTTVPQNPRLSDTRGKAPAAIIRLASEEGITGTGVLGRGIGLHLLSDLVRTRRAESLILSDGGLFVQVSDIFLERTARVSIDGTLVALKFESGK